jgi:hypothetical protein
VRRLLVIAGGCVALARGSEATTIVGMQRSARCARARPDLMGDQAEIETVSARRRHQPRSSTFDVSAREGKRRLRASR